jgi:PEP-CTERM motif
MPSFSHRISSHGPGLLLVSALAAYSPGVMAQGQIEVVFDDPGAQYAAYHADIERVTLAAGAGWLSHFLPAGSTQLLTVRIGFDAMATATGRSLVSSFAGLGDNGVNLFAQGAAHELLTGIDPNGDDADIEIMLGTGGYLQHELWFDPAPLQRSAEVPLWQTDAYSVLQHEFGHALGFNGWLDSSTGSASGDSISTFDALVGAHPLGDAAGLYFLGASAMAAYGGPVPLTDGNYTHLGNWAQGAGASLLPDLMNGMVFYRGTRYTVSALDLAVMHDLGLPSVGVVPEPATALLWLAGAGVLLVRRQRVRQRTDPRTA